MEENFFFFGPVYVFDFDIFVTRLSCDLIQINFNRNVTSQCLIVYQKQI